MQDCRNCHDSTSIVLRDLRMEKAWISGNPYQRWCGECGSLLHAAAQVEWESADEKYVKPRDDGEITLVENDFNCPNCDRYCHGYPAECTFCGVSFDWDN